MMDVLAVLERIGGSGGVVAFHGVGPSPRLPLMSLDSESLEQHLRFLKEQYDVIPLDDLLHRFGEGRSLSHCVAVTFDDAYTGVLTFALPLIRKLDIPITVFVTAEASETGQPFWWDAAAMALTMPDLRHSLFRAVHLYDGDVGEDRAMKALRAQVLERFAGRWPDPILLEQTPMSDVWLPLRADGLRQLAADDRVQFAPHGVTHAALPFLTVPEQEGEIKDSYEKLRETLPRVRPWIAYPYGLYNQQAMRSAVRVGMTAGFTMQGHGFGWRVHRMAVPRVGIGAVHGTRSVRLRLARLLVPVVIVRNQGWRGLVRGI